MSASSLYVSDGAAASGVRRLSDSDSISVDAAECRIAGTVRRRRGRDPVMES